MPVTSDASAFTSVTASPNEPYDADELPIELKIPLPSSSNCSDQGGEIRNTAEGGIGTTTEEVMVVEEQEYPEPAKRTPLEPQDDSKRLAVPVVSPGVPSISMIDLWHMARLERYQRRRTISIQADVDLLGLSCGLDRRLISTLSIAYGNMIDQFKTDDQAGFAGLYEGCEQLRNSCVGIVDSLRTPNVDIAADSVEPSKPETTSCIQLLPVKDQDNILAFVTRIRTDPDFLSDRIAQMSPSALTALTSSYHPAGIDFSVLPNHSHGKTQHYSRDSQMMKLSRRMDNLHRFHNQDPFFALLYGLFDASSKWGSREHFQRRDVWSTVCARNFIDGFTEPKPGSDELAIATLDGFAYFEDWTMKPKMETYLMNILAEGSFLLEPPLNQSMDFKEPLEMHNAKAAIAEADFFDKALTEMFGILTSEPHLEAVPPSVLGLIHAILRKIQDSKLRLRAKHFIVCRWYFATFISSIVVYPEVRGIMMTQHIGDNARQLILQKLVVRMQQRVFDVILQWNNHVLVSPEIKNGILAIFRSFEPPMLDDSEPSNLRQHPEVEATTRSLMLSSLDIVGLVETLCPDRPFPSTLEDTSKLGLISARPSTAGSSTLVPSSSELGSGVASSLAPSLSGTSMTSKTVYSGASVTDAPENPEDPHSLLKEEPSGEPSKGKGRVEEYLPAQLRGICRKMKDILGRDGPTSADSPSKSWTFIYYSEDGSKLSLNLGSPVGGLTESQASSGREILHWNTTQRYQDLKQALIMLLADQDETELQASSMDRSKAKSIESRPCDPLENLIEVAMTKAQSRLDFGTAHFWWKMLRNYGDLPKSTQALAPSHTLLQNISEDLRERTDTWVKSAKQSEARRHFLETLQRYQKGLLARMEEQGKALRAKMWYVSDVRHSATYEEALHVTRALRSMTNSKRAKQGSSISNWARQRLRGSSTFDKAEAQTLEALSAIKDYGGLSKIADEQVELTSRWLTRKSIENFCKGEERIHRFCYEVQKAVGKIVGTSLLESPELWSSNLFRRERSSFDTQRSRVIPQMPSSIGSVAATGLHSYGNSRPPIFGLSDPAPVFTGSSPRATTQNYGGFWSATQAPRESAGLGIYAQQWPALPKHMSPPISFANTFGSGLVAPPLTPPSPHPIFGGTTTRGKEDGEVPPATKRFTEQIKQILYSLLLSDLSSLLWNQGSETDAWINSFTKNENNTKPPGAPETGSETPRAADPALARETRNIPSRKASQQDGVSDYSRPDQGDHLRSELHPEKTDLGRKVTDSFPFFDAYTKLLKKMSLAPDPWIKLQMLYELENLVLKSIQDSSISQPPSTATGLKSEQDASRRGYPSFRSKSVPRTKATSLEEVIANCTERRAGTLKFERPTSGFSLLETELVPSDIDTSSTDDIVNTLLSIFHDPNLRPKTLFRDLQYIAAFIPSDTLDRTVQGKAFWNVGLAALALKEDLCESMISRANRITTYHISVNKPADLSTDSSLASTTLRDAANLWLITAKEGSPIAARELGLFYLTHPELIPRVTMPFSKAMDVFKSVILSDSRPSDKEKGALDPLTFAVIIHWMEIAANGGDRDARDFLKGNGVLIAGR